jgi:IS5 family transposase
MSSAPVRRGLRTAPIGVSATGGRVDEAERRKNRNKSRIRAKGEHPFLVLKRIFGFAKVCYRGLLKNGQRLLVACALINIFQLRRPVLRLV